MARLTQKRHTQFRHLLLTKTQDKPDATKPLDHRELPVFVLERLGQMLRSLP